MKRLRDKKALERLRRLAKEGKVVVAPRNGVLRYGDISDPFFRDIFGLDPDHVLVTDESSLWDFKGCQDGLETVEAIKEKIGATYGLDDVPDNLHDLFAAIDAKETLTASRRIAYRDIATRFVEAANASTVCSECGAQPVEWHNDEHAKRPNARVSSLRTQGASVARIKGEMDRCIPLCRKCHMLVDGRMEALQRAAPRQKGMVLVGKLPCIDCGRLYKPLRRGRCWSCSERARCGGRLHAGCDECKKVTHE